MSESPPPLPPSPLPPSLIAACRTALVTDRVRTTRARLEVHRTHLRIETAAAPIVSAYARRMSADDIVLSYEQIIEIRPVGMWTALVELPFNSSLALAGPSVRATLEHVGDQVDIAARRFRPFFVGFWLVNNRNSRIVDARRLP